MFTVIKESDGGFSVLGHPGKNNKALIATQGETWEELREKALDAVNTYLKRKGEASVTIDEIDFSFDLPSFFDAYPQLNASTFLNQTGVRKSISPGKKQATDRQVNRIVAAVKQLGSEISTFPR